MDFRRNDSWLRKKFTRDELAKYNGDGEKPHYMAIDGLVYDITDAPKKESV